MITNAYIVFKDMPRSPDAITHKGFRLQCAWGLILAGAGRISTSQAPCLQSQNPSGRMSKETLLHPWAEAVAVGAFQFILGGGEEIGVLALPLEGEGESNKRL